MKYLWSNQNGIQDNLSMQATGDFIEREYHIKVMDNQQHDSPKKMKRFRSAFTTDQVNYLEKQFKKFPYIGNANRKEVAQALNIPERAVKIWFQNRRMKEKKESNTKEFDDEQGIRKSLEFAKDQLNNVGIPSPNEAQSLALITNLKQGNGNKNPNNITPNVTQRIPQGTDSKSSETKMPVKTVQNIVTTAKVIHPPSVFVNTGNLPSDVKASAGFSIDLCKKYKAETLAVSSNDQMTLRNEAADVRKEESKPTGLVEQIIPEDLSPNRKVNIPSIGQQQSLPVNASDNAGYVSLVPTVSPFYTQPYISASGVIWKPVSVMPVVTSNSAPISAPSNTLLNVSTLQTNVAKKVCNCDCHLKQMIPQVPFNFAPQTQNPQYIITALPFQNTSTKL